MLSTEEGNNLLGNRVDPQGNTRAEGFRGNNYNQGDNMVLGSRASRRDNRSIRVYSDRGQWGLGRGTPPRRSNHRDNTIRLKDNKGSCSHNRPNPEGGHRLGHYLTSSKGYLGGSNFARKQLGRKDRLCTSHFDRSVPKHSRLSRTWAVQMDTRIDHLNKLIPQRNRSARRRLGPEDRRERTYHSDRSLPQHSRPFRTQLALKDTHIARLNRLTPRRNRSARKQFGREGRVCKSRSDRSLPQHSRSFRNIRRSHHSNSHRM
jgi:hypothetical protein